MSDFTVTHVAPPEGLQVWQAPDPSVPAVAPVQAGVQMQLLERRGAWARVAFSNGWSGWVDGRRIVEVGPAPAAPPPQAARPAVAAEPTRPVPRPEPEPRPEPVTRAEPEPARPEPVTRAELWPEPAGRAGSDPLDDPFSGLEPELRPEPTRAPSPAAPGPAADRPAAGPSRPARDPGLHPDDGGGRRGFDPASVRPIPALLGAGAVLLGTFFAWITIDGADGNAYDVPLEFLWDYQSASGGGLKLGLVLLALAGAVGALCFLPGKVKPRRIVGGVVIGLTLLYAVQLQRALSSAGDAAPGLISALGFGVLLTLVGAGAIVYDTEDTALHD